MNGVWAEDYYESGPLETRGTLLGNKEGMSLAFPEPATLSLRASPQFDLSHPGEEEESSPPRQTRSHQRSLTSLLPFRTKSRENSKSPERSSPATEQTQREVDFMPTLTGDTDEVVMRVGEKQRGGISSWFSGSSAPIPLGIPVTEFETAPFNESLAEASPQQERATKLRKRPNLSSVESTGNSNSSNNMPIKSQSSAAVPSRFNFFQKAPPKQTIQLPERLIEDDELLTLDTHAALLPRPSFSHDAFSPAAYKNLLMNAEGLLVKFQTAYKLRTLSQHELSAEIEAQDEELEEAETRAQSLKSQLEEMSHRVAEQDKVIEDLVEQLATEKQARTEERLAHDKAIALVRAAEAEELSKKLYDHRPRRWRESGGSASTECDSDADLGSPTDSIFSRSRSPAPTITSMLSSATCTSADTTPEILQASFARVVSLQSGAVTQRPNPMIIQQTQQQTQQHTQQHQQKPSGTTRLQKILNGISPAATSAECENCRGADSSVAWDTVGLLRAENKSLKEQVGSLESAVGEALDLCSGLGRS